MKHMLRCLAVFLFCFSITLSAVAAEPPASPASATASDVISQTVNINTADAQTIVAAHLKGIGKKRADAIVAYRQQHGSFKSLDDLTNVRGISQAVVDANRSRLLLS